MTFDDPKNWLEWAHACVDDPNSPSNLRDYDLGMLTGQDRRAITAFLACCSLYGGADPDGERASLEAMRALLRYAMQEKCWPIARELIPCALDWSDRERLWPRILHGMKRRGE